MVPFQGRFVAVYGLVPVTFAFQPLVRSDPSVYCQLTSQPLIVELPLLVIRILATNPVSHSFATMYSHTAAKELIGYAIKPKQYSITILFLITFIDSTSLNAFIKTTGVVSIMHD